MTYTQEQIAKAERYVRTVRNARKSDYAKGYLSWKLGTRKSEPSTVCLSYMGAQAVRLSLDGILR